MAEIENKYSDYQKSECDDFGFDGEGGIQPLDSKLCPTCQPDPNFKLEGNWWEIEDAYLNGLHCEYHVRVYENERAVNSEIRMSPLLRRYNAEDREKAIINIAAGRILVDLDKPLNNATRLQVQNACYVKDVYRDLRSSKLGEAYLIAVPAFNFDQIPSNDSEDSDPNDENGNMPSSGEVILNTNGLYRKLRQLRLAIGTYGIYYRSLQSAGRGFVIREEDDETRRISYKNTVKNLKNFINTLHEAMRDQGYAKLNRPGWFKSKRAEKIKIIFKDGDSPFELKDIWILPDDGCGKYEKLKIKSSSSLRKPRMKPIYNFLANLDPVINDITAKETKPWLDFTIEHFYPEYIVDYGDVASIDDTRSGLECLLQDQLGIGNGQIIDSLAKEILSAFNNYEKEMAEQICQAIKDNRPSPSPTEVAENRTRDQRTDAKAEREAAMRARYEKEFENKAIKQMVQIIKEHAENTTMEEDPSINKSNVFKKMKDYGFDSITVEYPPPFNFEVRIANKEQLTKNAKHYAQAKFEERENGSFADQIQNSPHFQEAMDAARETLKSPENTFIQGYKDVIEDISDSEDILDVISVFGICGLSKTAGKALECLAGGVSFDRFLGILIDKTFDFMEVNTLSLFMNGLPIDFREALNEEIEKQFGDIKLSDLVELKKAEGGSQKLKDFVTLRSKKKQAIEIYKENKPWSQLTQTQKDLIKSLTGGTESQAATEYGSNLRSFNDFVDDERNFKTKDNERFFKSLIRPNADAKITNGISRIKSALDSAIVDNDEELDKYTKSMKSFEETSLGVKVDAVFDVVIDFAIDYTIDSLGVDDLLARLQKYPIVDFVAGLIDKYLGSCPATPLIYPPPGDFLKSLSVDVCDPTISLTMPKINIPSINWKFWAESQFNEIFREAIIKLVSQIAVRILKKLLANLEGSLCNLLEAVGGFSADALRNKFDDLTNSFFNALNEAFCNDGEDPSTAEDRAKALADALFSPFLYDAGADYEGAGTNAANVISSVASTDEFLAAMVAEEGQEDEHFNNRIANAINALVPEMSVLLGDPSQVAYFFRNLGSFLTPEDRDRIRDLLAAGIPNLPLSPALCLTNDQLNDWNDLRSQLLRDQGLDPDGAGTGVGPAGTGIITGGDGTGDGDGLGGRSIDDILDDLNKKTEDALEDMFDIVGDANSDGPFAGSITNEALKDVCNPDNVINAESQSEFDKAQEDELVENFFDNISRSLETGFFSKGGILAEATADTLGRREFWRGFQKFFRANYSNSQEERDLKYASKNWFGQKWMDIGYIEVSGAPGVYPETVAIKQRKQILDLEDEPGREYEFNSKGLDKINYIYADKSDDFEYKLIVQTLNSNTPKDVFDYRLRVDEYSYENNLIFDETENDKIADFIVPISVSEPEREFFRSQGFQIDSNQKEDLRGELFAKILQSKVSISDSAAKEVFKSTFEMINKNLTENLLTSGSDGIPVGYKFGYITDELTKDSFKYTPNSDPEKLGTFASTRVKPLDPKIYGGSYKRPAYYVEPRQFFGWIELGMKAFTPQGGCDPKNPPLFDMSDIKGRVKNLGSSLREDPRLSKPADCIKEKPFHLLLDRKNKSKLDGVVRTTIRTYLGEYFMKGYGLFSNLQIRSENFDQSLMLFIVNKMKLEMQELGTFASNRKVRIVRERYWYSFLEQSVEAYQRMIDVDGIQPPEKVSEALNKIQIGIDKYRPVTKRTKKAMIQAVGESTITRPRSGTDALDIASQTNVDFTLQSVAFRLSDQDERDNFFNGAPFNGINKIDIRFSSLKKLNFFKKIYFIKVFEKEAILIMSELIRSELDRLASSVVDGISDKPYYYDLKRSFFGMNKFFPNSSSRVGTNAFYVDKQRGVYDPGTIPEVQESNSTSPVEPTGDAQFIIESYVRLEENADAPGFIRNRPAKYRGFVSLRNMSEFITSNLGLVEDAHLSDYFGDLSFTYSGSLRSLFDKGFASDQDIDRLIELNRSGGVFLASNIRRAQRRFIIGQDFEDLTVTYDESFLLEGESPTPSGTTGSTGVKYGLRMSLVLPTTAASQVQRTPEVNIKSRNERSYFFDDGGVVIPLATAEIDVKDSAVEDFDPISGVEPYDLECLINKLSTGIEFEVMLEKIFNVTQCSSMLAIYCMESLPAAIGRDETERVEVDDDPDVDDWDRVVNKFGKNFLRREFKSLYLARHPDGQSNDDDDGDSEMMRLMRFSNPFSFFALPSVKLPWWLKRRMRTNVYDANGQECADPKKDLQ